MENSLISKTDTEIINTHKNLKILLIIATIAMLILLGIVVYSLFVKEKPVLSIMFGGIVLPYILLGSNYDKYYKEKKRRNL